MKQSSGGLLWKKVFLKISQNSKENTKPNAFNFTEKETQTQVFSNKLSEIFKNTFYIEHLRWLLLKDVALTVSIPTNSNIFFAVVLLYNQNKQIALNALLTLQASIP